MTRYTPPPAVFPSLALAKSNRGVTKVSITAVSLGKFNFGIDCYHLGNPLTSAEFLGTKIHGSSG